MREAAVEILSEISDPRAVDVLIERGLLSDSKEIRQETYDALELITGQEFTSYQQALQWWDQNRGLFKFDEQAAATAKMPGVKSDPRYQ
jgi:HEAT repeat protein